MKWHPKLKTSWLRSEWLLHFLHLLEDYGNGKPYSEMVWVLSDLQLTCLKLFMAIRIKILKENKCPQDMWNCHVLLHLLICLHMSCHLENYCLSCNSTYPDESIYRLTYSLGRKQLLYWCNLGVGNLRAASNSCGARQAPKEEKNIDEYMCTITRAVGASPRQNSQRFFGLWW